MAEEPHDTWCEGLPRVGAEPLEDAGLAEVRRALRRWALRDASVVWGVRLLLGAFALVLSALVWAEPAGAVALLLLSPVIGLAVGGLAGALLEVWLNRFLLVRVLFGTAALALLIGIPAGQLKTGAPLNLVLNIALIVLTLGGLPLLVVRALDARRHSRALWAARSAPQLSVVRFAGVPVPPEEDATEGPEVEETSLDILVPGNLVLRRDGEPSRYAQVADVVFTARAEPDAAETLAPDFSAPGLLLTHRRMSAHEHEELMSARGRLLRRLPWHLLAVGYFSLTLLRGVEWVLGRREAGPSILAACAAALVVLVTLALRMRTLRRLRLDADDARVVRIRSRETDGGVGAPLDEFLPQSRLAWLQRGQPASWRRMR